MTSISKSVRYSLLAGSVAFGIGLHGAVLAQGGFAGLAPPSEMDAWSGGAVGSGAGNVALDRARGLGQDPFGTPGADPFAQPGGDPFGGGGGGFGGEFGGADPAFGGGFGGADPAFGGGAFGAQAGGGFQVPEIPKIQAIYGTRVVCRVTGEMLDDAVEVKVFDTFRDSYYDDGKTGMDYQANDFVYTNVTSQNDVMSPEAHLVMSRIIQGLRSLEDLEPNRFFNVLVASTDPLAGVPQMVDLEKDRDERLSRWAQKFLQDFRVDPSESEVQGWDFFPTYLPKPPLPPYSNIPASFFPPQGNTEGGQQAQAGGGGGFDATNSVRDAFGANNIAGNAGASSSYFGGAGFGK